MSEDLYTSNLEDLLRPIISSVFGEDANLISSYQDKCHSSVRYEVGDIEFGVDRERGEYLISIARRFSGRGFPIDVLLAYLGIPIIPGRPWFDSVEPNIRLLKSVHPRIQNTFSTEGIEDKLEAFADERSKRLLREIWTQ